jgi:hypothetical protein
MGENNNKENDKIPYTVVWTNVQSEVGLVQIVVISFLP